MEKNGNITFWLNEDYESSNQGSESINENLDSIQITSSSESSKSEEEYIPRGKPRCVKSGPAAVTHNKNKISYFLKTMEELESKKSSLPASENPAFISQLCDSHINTAATYPKYEDKQFPLTVYKQTPKKFLQDIIMKKFLGKKRIDMDHWLLDFGDTHLIKCCRRGQVSDVEKALKEIGENHQWQLVNHQNAAKETALSIATYQMNEIIINLLLVNGATPQTELAMKNNVLHIAADLTYDKERKTFEYLVNGIKSRQIQNLLPALLSKNIFNCDPIQILRIHQIANSNDSHLCYILHNKINSTQQLINNLYNSNVNNNTEHI